MRDATCYPTNLQKLGKDMVRKCRGLPLAICVLGGILATKRAEIKEWEYVNRNINSIVNKGKNGGIMGILELSYNDLPVHLKPCFLYLGLFPEDYAIPRKKLVQLWIAEGFISHMKEDALVTLEDIGKHQYYAELIQRCMIQPDKDTNPWRKKACRMHDLMRDLCLLKAKQMNFGDVYNDHHTDGIRLNSSRTDTCRRLRRYAIHLNDQAKRYDDLYFNNSTCALRTLLVNNPRGNPLTPLKYQNIKLLRVLDLENARNFSTNITQEVTKLVHLRYLALGKGQLDIPIPSSIGNLRNLQTLKLPFRGLVPDTVTNCVQLRHLEIGFGEVTDSFQIENLINLQILSNVKAGKWIRKGCLGKLSKLRNLSVKNISRTQTDVLIHEIADKKSSSSDDQYQNPIRVLRLESTDNFDNKIFDSLTCCHNLYRLQLNGKLDVLNLQKYPPNLSKLTLDENMLNEDPMKTLRYLPKLKSLVMHRTYTGEEMVCSAKGFPQLQVLIIFGFDRLKTWTVEQGGMPRLKELHLNVLPELRMLPEGLRFITTLEKLRINSHMPTIKDRVVRERGEDWHKIQHIPSYQSEQPLVLLHSSKIVL
ncbi:hypothetical protein C5167_021533 [Papaver somniferum]|nr:hypothetical protein C5167_021533 [Papaver somniferum]